MMTIFKKNLLLLLLAFVSSNSFSQEDLLSLLDTVETVKTHEKVIATFKAGKIINMQSTETVKAKTMDFKVTHRFGNIGTASGGGPHTLFGFDNSTDIRISFDFGITDKLTLGVGRSKQKELIDGLVKYKLLSQTIDNHIPVSIVFYGNMSYTPQEAALFYSGMGESSEFKKNDIHRFSYTSQLLIARKFNSKFSMELAPSFQHRNFVLASINTANDSKETNELISLAAGFRLKITKRMAIITDYYYTFSKYRKNNTASLFYQPLAIGIEIETGGHVFNINFTNASGIMENNYIPNTTDNWLKGGYKLGFNISRVFNIGHRK